MHLRALIASAAREAGAGAGTRTAKRVPRTVPGGYLLDSGQGAGDIREFERLADAGYRTREAGDRREAARLLRAALGRRDRLTGPPDRAAGSSGGHDVPGGAAGGEPGARHEPHHRPEHRRPSEPVKYRPGTDDSDVPRSAGAFEPGTHATARRAVGDRKGRASRSSR